MPVVIAEPSGIDRKQLNHDSACRLIYKGQRWRIAQEDLG
jgi:hypothetical protein